MIVVFLSSLTIEVATMYVSFFTIGAAEFRIYRVNHSFYIEYETLQSQLFDSIGAAEQAIENQLVDWS
jgi:hypothetical protein